MQIEDINRLKGEQQQRAKHEQMQREQIQLKKECTGLLNKISTVTSQKSIKLLQSAIKVLRS